jgi:hypothetical protein
MREELRKLDLDSLVQQGMLKPLGRGWYEVPGNVHDLPEAVGFLGTEAGTSASGRPMIKLCKPGPFSRRSTNSDSALAPLEPIRMREHRARSGNRLCRDLRDP